jgi:hypothetical protein
MSAARVLCLVSCGHAGWSISSHALEPRHMYGLHFCRRSSRPTGSSGEVLKIVRTSFGRMVKC